MRNKRVWGVAVLSLLAVLGGCAKLEVAVDVYKGDMTQSPEKRIDGSMANAQFAYHFAEGYEAELARQDLKKCEAAQKDDKISEHLCQECPNYGPRLMLQKALQAYRDDRVDERWKEYLAQRPERYPVRSSAADPAKDQAAQDTVEARLDAARETRIKLAHALTRFGNHCIAAGQERALGPVSTASVLRTLSGILSPAAVPIPLALSSEKVEAGLVLEISGSEIVALTDDTTDVHQRIPISQIMQSTAPGLVATALRNVNDPPWVWKIIGLGGLLPGAGEPIWKALDEHFWSEINNINVDGFAETNFVLVKDEIGNWHLKTAELNQADVTNAVFDGTTMMVKVAAAAYGVPLPGLTNGAPRGRLGTTDLSAADTIALDAARAERTRNEMRMARAELVSELAAARETADAAAARLRVANAVKAYKARLGSLDVTPTPTAPTQASAKPAPTVELVQASTASTKALAQAVVADKARHKGEQALLDAKAARKDFDAAQPADQQPHKDKITKAKEAAEAAYAEATKAREAIDTHVNEVIAASAATKDAFDQAQTAYNTALPDQASSDPLKKFAFDEAEAKLKQTLFAVGEIGKHHKKAVDAQNRAKDAEAKAKVASEEAANLDPG